MSSLNFSIAGVDVYPLSFALLIPLAAHGLRSASLSPGGAAAAVLFGYTIFANPSRVFGACLLGHYISGSILSKYKAAVKATLEAPEHSSPSDVAAATAAGKKARRGPRRTAAQVACNAYVGAICAVIYRVLQSDKAVSLLLQSASKKDGIVAQLGLADTVKPLLLGGERAKLATPLLLTAIAFWGVCAGDTWASELGILAKNSPFLITTLRVVPPGTNGGVTLFGTLCSVLGGVLIGGLAAGSGAAGLVGVGGTDKALQIGAVVALSAWSGLVGSFVDSFLGATVQQTLYSPSRKLVVHDRLDAKDKDEVIESVGGLNLLSNNAVNALSSGAVAAAVGAWSWARQCAHEP